LRVFLLLLADVTANTASHIWLKQSSRVRGRKLFLIWQAAGNLSAFLGVLAYTSLLRGISLHVAYPLTEGLTAAAVLLVGATIVFREELTPLSLVGTGLILCGITIFGL
jgi:multidrug transporter EmrE-like cation transporter